MTIPASHCEAILRGMSKRADKDGDWVQIVWQVHPQEVPQALWNADLRSRWQLAFVEIGADEQPIAPQKEKPARKPAATLAEKMRRLGGVPAFQFWLAEKNGVNEYGFAQLTKNETYAQTIEWVKAACKISSTKEFDSDPDAQFLGNALLAEYEQATGRMATRHG